MKARRNVMPNRLARRNVLFAFLCAVLPDASPAQTAPTMRRVAFFFTGDRTRLTRWVDEFKAGMAERGWRDGQDLRLEVAAVDADLKGAATIQSDVAATRPDVVVVASDTLAKAAGATSMRVPVVFVYGLDPVGNGLVRSLDKPGGNVTGLSAQDRELVPKRVTMNWTTSSPPN